MLEQRREDVAERAVVEAPPKPAERSRQVRLQIAGGFTAALRVDDRIDGLEEQRDLVRLDAIDCRASDPCRLRHTLRGIESACLGLDQETCITIDAPERLRSISAELDAYATHLEGLDVPDEFSDDVAIQVAWLRDAVDGVREGIATASTQDEASLREAFERRIEAVEAFAGQLDPDWARAAFLSSFGDDRDSCLATVENTRDLTAGRIEAARRDEEVACEGSLRKLASSTMSQRA